MPNKEQLYLVQSTFRDNPAKTVSVFPSDHALSWSEIRSHNALIHNGGRKPEPTLLFNEDIKQRLNNDPRFEVTSVQDYLKRNSDTVWDLSLRDVRKMEPIPEHIKHTASRFLNSGMQRTHENQQARDLISTLEHQHGYTPSFEEAMIMVKRPRDEWARPARKWQDDLKPDGGVHNAMAIQNLALTYPANSGMQQHVVATLAKEAKNSSDPAAYLASTLAALKTIDPKVYENLFDEVSLLNNPTIDGGNVKNAQTALDGINMSRDTRQMLADVVEVLRKSDIKMINALLASPPKPASPKPSFSPNEPEVDKPRPALRPGV
jgi:hypothetical protein